MIMEDKIINYDKLLFHSQNQISFEFSISWCCDIFPSLKCDYGSRSVTCRKWKGINEKNKLRSQQSTLY